MPISVTEVGIKLIADFALLTQAEVKRTLEETEPVLLYTGLLNTDAAELFNPAEDFSFQGKGDLPAGLALATDGGFTHSALTTGGKLLIQKAKQTEFASAHNTWECSGRNRPTATPPPP